MLDNAASGSSYSNLFKVASIFVVLGVTAYFMLLNYTSEKQAHIEVPNEQQVEEVQTKTPLEQEEVLVPSDNLENIGMVEAEELEAEEEMTNEADDTTNYKLDEEKLMIVDEEVVTIDFNIADTETDSLKFEIIAPEKPCLYTSVFFKVRNRAEFDIISWRVNGKSFNGEYQFFEAGTYTIVAKTVKNGREYMDTAVVKLCPEAEFDFTYEQKEGIFNDFTVQFKTDANVQLKWLIQEKAINEQQPLYDFKKEGLYDVTAFSINENGCKTELYKPVAVVKDFHFYAPDAFTPNNDGVNDVFLPPVLNEIEYHYDLMVYDISGAEVFSTSQKGVGWNGKLNNNGQKLPIGNYIWKVIIKDGHGKERIFTGPIKIVELD